MNRFNVNFSSSPASEHLPSNSPQQRRRNIFTVPDDIASTTPAAPPPSQLFGSSQFGTGVSKLKLTRGSNGPLSAASSRFQPSRDNQNQTLGQPPSRLFEASTNTYTTDEDEDYTEDMEEDGDENEQHDVSRGIGYTRNTAPSLLKFSINSTQQSLRQSAHRALSVPSKSRLPRKGRYDVVPGLARDVSKTLGAATVTEADAIILETEDVMRSHDDEYHKSNNESLAQSIITAAAQELSLQWNRRSRYKSVAIAQNSPGPGMKLTPFEKAQYLATLLLRLHHPKMELPGSESLVYGSNHDRFLQQLMPEVLLEWLDKHHVNYGPLFDQVMTTTPAPSSNELYWDAIETFALRGKFEEVMELLRRGNLNHAVIDTPEGTKAANFSGTQLQLAEDAVYRARQLINTCPALQNADWDLGGQDWDVYRKQVEAEIDHLAEQVTSHEEEVSPPSKDFGFVMQPPGKSGLPFIVYQRLKTMYSIMLGDADEIIGLAQDWVEASMLLTVWWIPTSAKNVAQWSFDVSKANDPRIADADPHLKRLCESFLCVTDPDSDDSFQLNTIDAVEVGLGAILQGDIQACLQILQSLSLCVASAVAEIGALAGWLNSTTSSTGLDQADLMVLNYGSQDTPISKDDLLEQYARALFNKDMLHSEDGGVIEGWELSFSILSRSDDHERMHATISDILHELPVTDQQRTAKLVEICEQFGLEAEGRKVSENFADNLVNHSTDYGTALLCYARAHAEHKVRQLIDLLNSYCLVQSKAYPPNNEMDSALAQLVSSPKQALRNIAEVDPQAAETLQFYLVGYACIRRFYSLRDDHDAERGGHLRSLARKRAAAKALVAAINSAADSIYGGLYDSNRQSAIQVDGLLTLLGEATAFLAQDDEKRILSSDQMYAVLAAVEDLQTVNDRVYQAAQDCMEASLRNFHGSLPPSPHAMLKKSISSGTNSNFSFSMMGSEMLARSEESLGGKSLGSAVIVGQHDSEESQRGWDWRARFKTSGTTGAEVLKHLRLSIARELSRATVEEGSVIQ